jgi:hypothetical protein
MNSQLFLIIVVVIVLLIIHKTSNDMPVVQESANSVPVPVPVRLPQLENIFKNVLSNTMPMVQEPFNTKVMDNYKIDTITKLGKLDDQTLQRLKDWVKGQFHTFANNKDMKLLGTVILNYKRQ